VNSVAEHFQMTGKVSRVWLNYDWHQTKSKMFQKVSVPELCRNDWSTWTSVPTSFASSVHISVI